MKESLSKEFEMKDLGKEQRARLANPFSGKLSREGTEKLRMVEARSVTTPTASHMKLRSLSKDEKLEEAKYMENIPYSSAVGSLMYAMVGSKPDLGYAVGLVCRFMSSPGRDHWSAVK